MINRKCTGSKQILSPALGRSADELEIYCFLGLLINSLKDSSPLQSGVKRIHFWTVYYIEQIEIFFKEIAQNFG